MSAIPEMPKPLGSVLVVGGCGFLGHHIVNALLSPPYTADVSVLDLHTSRNRLPNVTYYTGDITDPSAVQSTLDRVQPRVIIHTASPVAIEDIPRRVLYKVNVEGTKTLLNIAKKTPSVLAFVYTSSASVIHDSVSDIWGATEELPVLRWPQQRQYYSETKAVADLLVLAANDASSQGGMRTVCIRPTGLFGEGDVQTIPSLIATLDSGKANIQLGDNTKLFDFTYVGNVADAHLLAAERVLGASESSFKSHLKVDGEAFLITNDAPIPFWTFARLVWRTAIAIGQENGGATASPLPTKVRVIPKSVALVMAVVMEWVYWVVFLGRRRPALTIQKTRFTTMERTFDITKAKERLGYVPRVSLEEGVERGVRWAREEAMKQKKMD